MQLLFSHYPGLYGTTVKVVTRSRYTHVDFVIDDQTLFGALSTAKSCVYHSYQYRLQVSTDIVLMDIPLKEWQQKRLLKWIKDQEGKSYDWEAVFTGTSKNRVWWREEVWICSELAAAGFMHVGKSLLNAEKTRRVLPSDLYRLPYHKTLLKGKL